MTSDGMMNNLIPLLVIFQTLPQTVVLQDTVHLWGCSVMAKVLDLDWEREMPMEFMRQLCTRWLKGIFVMGEKMGIRGSGHND